MNEFVVKHRQTIKQTSTLAAFELKVIARTKMLLVEREPRNNVNEIQRFLNSINEQSGGTIEHLPSCPNLCVFTLRNVCGKFKTSLKLRYLNRQASEKTKILTYNL
jgi:hypothetical protein